jgi:hypothetical protein
MHLLGSPAIHPGGGCADSLTAMTITGRAPLERVPHGAAGKSVAENGAVQATDRT